MDKQTKIMDKMSKVIDKMSKLKEDGLCKKVGFVRDVARF